MANLGKPFYTGSFRHNLDDKNRLTIPSAWRSAHGEADTFLATPNPAGYISVLPPAEVEKLYEKIATVPMSESGAQEEIATFFAASQAFAFDKQGRVPVSDTLLAHAGISKDAVLSGGLTKFNIYSPERWAAIQQKSSPATQSDFMRRFGI